MVLASAAQAAGVKTDRAFDCSINVNGQNGWVPSEIQFGLFESDTKVKARDPHTYFVEKKTIVTTLKSKANGKMSFRWRVALPTNGGHSLNVSYTVQFDPKTHKGTIVADVQGSSGRRNSGILTCKDFALSKLDQAKPYSNATASSREEPAKKTKKARQDERWQKYCRSGTIYTQNRKFCNTYPEQN